MAFETKMEAKIVAGVDQGSFTKAVSFARDTKKKINKELQTKLEIQTAQATIKLKQLRKQLRQATTDQRKVELEIDIRRASNNLTELRRNLRNLENTGDQVTSRLQRKFDGLSDRMKRKFDGLSDRMISFGTAVKTAFAAAVVGGTAAAIKGMVSLADKLEQARISFTTMLGSAEKANNLLRELSEFAKTTPFELTGIRETAKQLLAMGIAQERVLPTLKSLGDVSAGLSVPLERLALAYGQVIAKGKLQGGELKQFTEAGVPLLEELATSLGKSTAEIQRMISAGEIGSELVVEAFENMSGAGGRFANLMEEQATTLTGVWSNFKDGLSQVGEELGQRLLPILKGGVTFLNDLTGALQQQENTITMLADSTKSSLKEYESLQEQLEALNEQYLLGSVTEEEYNDKLNELNNSITDSVGIIGSQTDALKELKDLQMIINLNNERAKEILDDESLSLEQKRAKLAVVREEIDRLKLKQEEAALVARILNGEYGAIGISLDALSASKTIAEFDRLKAKQKEIILSSKKTVDALYAQSLAAGDVEGIERNLDAIRRLNTALYELENETFVPPTSNGGGGGGGGSRRSGGKSAATKQAKEKLKAEEDRIKEEERFEKEFLKRKLALRDEETEANRKAAKKLKDMYKDVYDSIEDEIKDSQKAIQDFEEDISGIDKSIAERVVEIQSELSQIGSQDVVTNEDLKRRRELQEELAKATANTTEEEIARAKELSEETVTDRLVREREELQAQKDFEIQNLQELDSAKAQLLKAGTDLAISEIDREKDALDGLISKLKEANSLRSGSNNIPTGDATVNNTTTNTSNTSNSTKNINYNVGTVQVENATDLTSKVVL